MRGDARLAARLLLRRPRLAGVVVTIGGCVALAGALRPWHVLAVDVAMLGGTSRATLPATGPDLWQSWVCVVLAVVVVVLGVLLALDRASQRARHATSACGVALVVLASSALLVVPGAEAHAPERASELLAVADELPVGVGLQVRVVTTLGPWLVVAGAVTGILGAARARED